MNSYELLTHSSAFCSNLSPIDNPNGSNIDHAYDISSPQSVIQQLVVPNPVKKQILQTSKDAISERLIFIPCRITQSINYFEIFCLSEKYPTFFKLIYTVLFR